MISPRSMASSKVEKFREASVAVMVLMGIILSDNQIRRCGRPQTLRDPAAKGTLSRPHLPDSDDQSHMPTVSGPYDGPWRRVSLRRLDGHDVTCCHGDMACGPPCSGN